MNRCCHGNVTSSPLLHQRLSCVVMATKFYRRDVVITMISITL